MEKKVFERFSGRYAEYRGCWVWLGSRANGYGMLWSGGKTRIAHRLAYEHFKGQIPDGLQIDHLCKNKGCVNPEHLEAVTPSENTIRSKGVFACRHERVVRPSGRSYCPECRHLEYEQGVQRSVPRHRSKNRPNPDRWVTVLAGSVQDSAQEGSNDNLPEPARLCCRLSRVCVGGESEVGGVGAVGVLRGVAGVSD